MVILDPDRDGCVVWLINSSITGYKNEVTRIKGNIFEVCESLVSRLAIYRDVKNQWGNNVKRLFWADDVYLDISAFGITYKDIFNDYGLDIMDIRAKNADTIIPKRIKAIKRYFYRSVKNGII